MLTYLLRGDRTLHQVTPLQQKGDRRSVVGMEYTETPKAISKGRVTGLYDGY
ncbi:HalD/BesD family halogenase [Dapis sp. BLCC M229]|uniref:HalD/BesD family halogenase n=1 Tax=Dapis sp. BLCC M229 TaxID=3400188 RepID=UPI003CF2E15A